MKVCVVGGGASGLACSVELLKNKVDVSLFEKNNILGKKLSLTGNGKCNVCNKNFSLDKYYCNNKEFLKKLFDKISIYDLINFFHEIGIELYEKDGYYYPLSNNAKAVVYALEDKIKSYNNFTLINNEITDINELNDFDKIIIATGGLSYPKTGSTGFGYEVAYILGHNLHKTSPALSALLIENQIEALAGIRIYAKCTLIIGNQEVYSEEGNIQFNKNSISGIPIMNCSSIVGRANHSSIKIKIDLMPNRNIEDLVEDLLERRDNIFYRDAQYFLSGLIDDKLASFLLDMTLGLKSLKTVHDLTIGEIDIIADAMKKIILTVRSTDGYDNAQITTGGINLDEINDDFSSKLNNKYHFIGECLDVDGICGGYNLTFAFTSGIACAQSISKN